MSAIRPPRFGDNFRAALSLRNGLVHLCRDWLGNGKIPGFQDARLALLELGHAGTPDGIDIPAVLAADSLRDIARLKDKHDSTSVVEEFWRVPVAAGVGGPLVMLTGPSAEAQARLGWLELLERWLIGDFPDERRQIEMPVLTRLDGGGEVAGLRLRALADGPPGLYPHPTMALFYGDPGFRASVANAWRAVDPRTRTVTWELRVGDQAVDHLVGGSAGGAFAVAMSHLERKQTSMVARALGVRSRAAVSAEVHPDGSLADIEGRDEKLAAAAQSKLRLVVLADSEGAGSRGQEWGDLRLRYASNVDQAVRATRGLVSRFTAAVAAVLFIAVAVAAILAIQNHRDAEKTHDERLSRVANELVSQATNARRDDLQLQEKLLLAASSVALAAHNADLARSAVSHGATPQPGVINRLNLTLAGPVDGLVPVDKERGVIAWSEAGHLVLVDSASGKEIGTFTEPPGDLSLAQPIPRAAAALAGTGLAAFVFQDPIRFGKTNPSASLVIFSTEEGLRVVGTVAGFTTEPTTAVGYAPTGIRLLTVSDRYLTVWDTTTATPGALDSCRWRPPHVSGDPVQVVSLPGNHPGLILDHGEVVRLESWEPDGRECRGQVIAPTLPGVAKQDFTNHLLAATEDGERHLVQYGVRRNGLLDIRSLGGATDVRNLGTHVVGLGTPSGDQLPVQLGPNSKPTVAIYEPVDKRLKQTVQFHNQSLPAVIDGESAFASEKGRVNQLSTLGKTYPPATTGLGHDRQLVNGIAMTGNAIAIANPANAFVLGLRDRRLDRVVTWPASLQLAGGDGRLNETLSLSASGRYLVAILDSEHSPRRLVLFDVQHHQSLNIAPELNRYTTASPIDVAFEHGSDQLLVEYLNGLLVRLRPTSSGWQAQALLRGQVGQEAFGLTLSDTAMFRIEVKNGNARVARYNEAAGLQQTWSLTPTHLTFGLTGQADDAQLAVLSDSRAALILDAGTVIPLLRDGRLGSSISLGDGPILDTAQIGDNDLLIARQEGTSTLNWNSGVAEDSTDRYGPLDAIASSPQFDLLAGSVWLTAQSLIMSLRTDAQTAIMCNVANGDLSRAAWRYFVKSVLSYRPLCGSYHTQGHELESLGLRSRIMTEPSGLATPTVSQADALTPACSKRNAKSLGWAHSPQGQIVICQGGHAIWLASGLENAKVSSGGYGTHALLMVTGHDKNDPRPETEVSELIDTSGNVVEQFITPGGTAALVGNQVAETERVGDLLVTTTYTHDPHSAGWIVHQQLPAGTARLPSTNGPVR